NRAYRDQPKAARVPMEMRVSMVAAPWRRLIQAARWNGQAPHTTTGAARVRESHCQYVNCRGGIMASRITGMDSAALIRVRRRRAWSSAALACSAGSGSAGVADAGVVGVADAAGLAGAGGVDEVSAAGEVPGCAEVPAHEVPAARAPAEGW